VPDRNVLAGIVFMLLSSCSWANLPAARQLGCGSPVTCWRRVRDWQQAGVWEHVKHDRIGRAGVTSPTTSKPRRWPRYIGCNGSPRDSRLLPGSEPAVHHRLNSPLTFALVT
jgi:Putative transposase of IS4/5 family (DUF4096)